MPLLPGGRGAVALECDEEQLRHGGLEESLRLRDSDLVEDRRASTGMLGATQADVRERDGVVIVTPAGALPDPLPARLAERLEALTGNRPVMIDLSGVAMAAPVVGMIGWALRGGAVPGQCCVVCARGTARVQLRRWHVSGLAVFGSVGDALQARRFAHEGYGMGWQPDPPRADRAGPGTPRRPT